MKAITLSEQHCLTETYSTMMSDYLDELNTISGLPLLSSEEKSLLINKQFSKPAPNKKYFIYEARSLTPMGFLLIGQGENCHPDADMFIEEAYIMPQYRKNGYMTEAIRKLIVKDKWTFCLFVLNGNKYAHGFWHRLFSRLGYKPIELSDVGAGDKTCTQYGYAPVL